MNTAFRYNASTYGLSQETFGLLTRLRPLRAVGAIWMTWVVIILLTAAARVLPAAFYLPLVLFIAGRQGALLQLVHEGAHGLLVPSKRLNGWLATWLLAAPIGIVYEGYREGHLRHHLFTGTSRDPRADREKYVVTDLTDPRFYLHCLKDIVGLSALGVFFAYEKSADAGPAWKKISRLALAQSAVLGLVFLGDVRAYALYWCVPAICAHMFLMRLRGIAEHGLPRQLETRVDSAAEGAYYTRSFLTPTSRYGFAPLVALEKCLIGSFSVHYHHEHHLFPTVPYYRLADLHRLIGQDVAKQNPDVYVSGYVAAVLRGWRESAPLVMTEPTTL